MEVEASNGNSTTLDSILTLIDTVSNRLQLVLFDYRGIDNLNLELRLLRRLLLRAGYLSSSLQSSLLFPFSEELRHMYFVLRSDSEERSRFMVGEIAKFRVSVKRFQQRFCEWNTCMFDEILDKLQPLVPQYPGTDGLDHWMKLEVELKLMKMLYLCTINWRNQATHQCLLSKIKSVISEKVGQIYFDLLKWRDLLVISHDLAQDGSFLPESLLCELYASMSDPLLLSNSYPWLCSELIAFFDYLLGSLGDIIIWGEALYPTVKKFIDPILKVIKFLNSFILFATLRVENPQGFARFFIHCQVSATSAACLAYLCWFQGCSGGQIFDELQLKCSELIKNIKPLNYYVTENYVETLMTARQSSPSYSLREVPADTFIVAKFVGFLLDHLRELLEHTNTSFMVNLDQRLRMLAEGLELFRTILKQQEEKLCDDLNQGENDVLIEAVYEGAILSFQLCMLKREERLEEEINDRIYQLVERFDSVKVKLARKFSTKHDISHLHNNDTVVGFDVEAELIKDKLIRGSRELDIVAIVGMMGVGKTTLARKVYQAPEVIDHFPFRAWCDISRARSVESMLVEIIRWIDPQPRISSIQSYLRIGPSLPEVIYKFLEHKIYLVVLDNVWGSEAWDLLKGFFPRQGNGSRILLTTPKNLPNINCAFIRNLGPLSDDRCLKILMMKLAYNEQHLLASLPVWPIVKLCMGLPLIAVCIAGILANLDQAAWKEVAMSLSSNSHCVIDEYVHHVLELGYKLLPPYLKPCLLYIAAFPQGQEISVKRLKWLCIAEGFVENDQEDTAEGYIMALIKRNFIMVAKQGFTGKVRTCRLHHSVREFCLAKAKGESSLQLIQDDDGNLSKFDKLQNMDRLFFCQPSDFAKLRLFSSGLCSSLLFHFKGCGGYSGNKSQLRSLVFHSKGVVCRGMSSYRLYFPFRLKLLSVLDLGEINLGVAFPAEIITLDQLRYLAVLGEMVSVPESIVNLQNLETLVLTTCGNGQHLHLPTSVWYLRKLRHLHVHGSLADLDLCSGTRLNDLVTCSTLKLRAENAERSMKNFPRIQKLKLLVLITASATTVKFHMLDELESLKLGLLDAPGLHINFTFPSALKKLTLQKLSWEMIMSAIGGLPNLQVLKLLSVTFREQIWEMKEEKFPNLKFFKLQDSNISRWRSCDCYHFPRLEILVLNHCLRLRELPFCLTTISTLRLIQFGASMYTNRGLWRNIGESQKRNGNKRLNISITPLF